MRRGIPSNRRWAAGPGRWTPAAAGASLASWMRGDDLGAAINTTPTPHQYAAIPDRGSLGGQYEQATSANQPHVSTLWTPGPAPLFDGGRRLEHSADPADWAVLHDGTSNYLLSFVAVLDMAATTTILGTFDSSVTSAIGFNIRVGSGGNMNFRWHNGSGTAALFLNTALGTVVSGVPFMISVSKVGTTVAVYKDGSLLANGTLSSPTTDPPNRTMIVGASSTGTEPIAGELPELVLFSAASGSGLPSRVQRVEPYLSRWSYTP